jgi:hypothetical protein
MNTIELAYQPFAKVAQSTRSGNGWLWLLLGLATLGLALFYATSDHEAQQPTLLHGPDENAEQDAR